MKIRPEQMASLGAMRLDDFVASTAEHLGSAYPEFTFGRTPEQIDEAIRGFIREAQQFGLAAEHAVHRYIEYRLELRGRAGGLLDGAEWAWARAILSDPSLGERAKIARIDELAYGGPPAEDDEEG